jgi:glycosyltransferase involved in cell wall biosynthesis
MPSITVHLITKNNQATLKTCLNSLLPLAPHFIVCDLGSSDSSLKICQSYGAEEIKLSFNNDYATLRNKMAEHSKTDWQLVLDPWEEMIGGHDQILKASPGVYKIHVIQNDLITKSARLWHGRNLKFVNPVYETLDVKDSNLLNVYVKSGQNTANNLHLIEEWKRRSPLAIETYYYEACTHLAQKNWQKFLNTADYYLFQNKGGIMPITMTHYYCATVQCYLYKNYQKATNHILQCLVKQPTMAEFWCLLGDIYYAAKEYHKAKNFYENAMILGTRRLKSDDWPIEISKYRKYPSLMIESCTHILQESKLYASR